MVKLSLRSATRSRRHLDGTVGALSTIDKSGVMGLSGHALERVSGVTGVMIPSFGGHDKSVLRPKTVGMTFRAKSASRFC
jgi:hypothetical protein